jgi:hypothetical protein
MTYTFFIYFAGDVYGDSLDQDLGHPLKGRGEDHFEGRLPMGGDCGHGDLP